MHWHQQCISQYIMKISIIIPVYNNGEHLREALNSVFTQTLEEIEVICVNDGSTDQSMDILSEYEEKYKNIQVIHQRNQGSGVARNKGMKAAKGKYIAFLDGDDFFFDCDVLLKLYENAENHGVKISGGSACNYRDGIYTFEGLRAGNIFKKDELVTYKDFQAFCGFWKFIYRRDFLLDNEIFFPPYKRCQDPPFFVRAMILSEKFYATKNIVYCYRKEHKVVRFNEEKIIDYACGIRDILLLSNENRLGLLHTDILNDVHGELSAMMYQKIADGCSELEELLKQIDDAIDEELIDRKRLCVQNIHLVPCEQVREYLTGVNDRKELFLEHLRSKERVYIFGAGLIGKKVVRFLKKESVPIEAVVVTKKEQNPNYVDDIEVIPVDDIDITGEESVVIATFAYLQAEIQKELEDRKCEDIISLNIEEFMIYQGEFEH